MNLDPALKSAAHWLRLNPGSNAFSAISRYYGMRRIDVRTPHSALLPLANAFEKLLAEVVRMRPDLEHHECPVHTWLYGPDPSRYSQKPVVSNDEQVAALDRCGL